MGKLVDKGRGAEKLQLALLNIEFAPTFCEGLQKLFQMFDCQVSIPQDTLQQLGMEHL